MSADRQQPIRERVQAEPPCSVCCSERVVKALVVEKEARAAKGSKMPNKPKKDKVSLSIAKPW